MYSFAVPNLLLNEKKWSKSFDKKISSGIRLLFDIRISLNTIKKNTGLVEMVMDL